jgi:hypothetical protein
MNSNQRAQYLLLSTLCFVLTVSACTSKQGAKTEEPGPVRTSDSANSHVDVMCVGDRINNPPEPFHYSYKYSDASGSTSKEADITPQAMDITIKDQSGSRSFHGVRSDEASWSRAVVDLSSLNMTGMMSRLDSLNGTSALSQQATETMNGYDSTRYAIDTTKASTSDQQKLDFLFGQGSFEKGAIWATSDGCAVKLVLDERVSLGGNLKDAHYELARIRK